MKISRSFPSERNRICMSLQRNNGADLAVLHRIIGEERDPFVAFKDASPAAEDVVTLVDCVHNRIRGKVVWEDVEKLKLGKRSVIAKSPSNTIFATELGLWFTCAEDEGDESQDQTEPEDDSEEIEFNSESYKLPRKIASAVKVMSFLGCSKL